VRIQGCRLHILFGRDNAIINDNPAFLLEADHDLTIMNAVDAFTPMKDIAIGTAKAHIQVFEEFI
jgi:hypothetical protein